MIKTFNFSANGFSETLAIEPVQVGFSQQDAFVCLYDAYVERIRGYVRFRVADERMAEDITAQVFVEVWDQLPDYQPGKALIVTWLYSLAQGAIDDYYLGSNNSFRPGGLSLEENAVQAEAQERKELQVALQPLSVPLEASAKQEQQALVMGFTDERSVLEISERLEAQIAPERASKIRALKELVNYLAPEAKEYKRVMEADIIHYSFA